ncbi:hypothetical protein O5O45_02780 [Hahella aquimaris]|uniref:hypothetical protein n=1 Tax=Hahella sp. HNIBRBA332 TaxID=3015983 RepID=UPI00273A7CE2|nr:hypothetical protein [Hahella sp. HNIBRBA332]WLQ14862.1 hypothetical protein O5O45_02780 [Hahella sp. HNIBRBA332]
MTNKDQRYIRIAQACLRAINETSTDKDALQENIRKVYEAIDIAFKKEFLTIEQNAAIAESALKKICELSARESVSEAKTIATAALDALQQANQPAKHH